MMAAKEKPDYTAIGIASIRATESKKSEETRLFYDPFATIFAHSSITGYFLLFLGRIFSKFLKTLAM
jgi:O-methyltransferase involved in polyketide biosynthesis